MESVLELGLKPASTPSSNTDHQEARLCLMCASLCPTAGVMLFDLRILQQPTHCDKQSMLSQSMYAIKRASNWPQAYADTP